MFFVFFVIFALRERERADWDLTLRVCVFESRYISLKWLQVNDCRESVCVWVCVTAYCSVVLSVFYTGVRVFCERGNFFIYDFCKCLLILKGCLYVRSCVKVFSHSLSYLFAGVTVRRFIFTRFIGVCNKFCFLSLFLFSFNNPFLPFCYFNTCSCASWEFFLWWEDNAWFNGLVKREIY